MIIEYTDQVDNLVIGIKGFKFKDSYFESDYITMDKMNIESCFDIDYKSKNQSIVNTGYTVQEPN